MKKLDKEPFFKIAKELEKLSQTAARIAKASRKTAQLMGETANILQERSK
jgi:hypothetical protein